MTGATAARKPGKFLTAEWRFLAMLNYEVDPAILSKRVPKGTELDSWNGKTFVSLVGFLFLKTKVLGLPIPFHRNFEELNLRFYVKRRHPDGDRRGVVFIKEIVPRFWIAWVARTVYNENYVSLPMDHEFKPRPLDVIAGGHVAYSWSTRGRENRLCLETDGVATPAAPGSEEEFITEHYWGYAAQQDGGTKEYEVEHPPWRIWRSRSSGLDCDARGLYGDEFAGPLSGKPSSAFLADGSEICVRKGVRLV